MDVFEAFEVTPYTFLKLAQGGVRGNTAKAHTDTTGVFKERNGMVQNNNLETVQSDATLHIRPDEPFIAELQAITKGNQFLVGNGIRATKNGFTQDYRIIGQKEGFNYEDNVLEFYLVTLKAESLVGGNAGSS